MHEATLLSEGVSVNGKLYTVEETDFNGVAQSALGKKIYFGINVFGEHNAPKIKGTFLQKHTYTFNKQAKAVGKIMKSWFDKATRKVKAKLKIWEPSLIHRIREGFKVSVRGIFNRFRRVLYGGKKAIQVMGLKIKDIQLLEPTTKTGIKGAQVERILEETMSFSFEDEDLLDIARAVGVAYHEGLI